MAIITFQKPDSDETPYKVVKGVMRLGRQLKMKGYRKCVSGDVTESSDEEESSDDDDSESSSDSNDERAYRYSKKSGRKSKKFEKPSERKYTDKSKKKSPSREDDSIRTEMKELRGMLQDLVKSQKVSPSTEVITTRRDEDVIRLDSYAVNRTYGGYPQRERYGYAQFNQGQQAERTPQYPNRRSYSHRFTDPSSSQTMERGQDNVRMGPATLETVQSSYQTPHRGNSSM
ncbi:hypothetical protein HOY82DRAFT_596727 [Tuber indicum]|nr:hypothetical protein HOY82DRAFT_596727 [Tuber indicum]